MNFVDLHTHTLPGLDDGASTIEESLAMLKEQVKQQVNILYVTPHYIPNSRYVSDKDQIKLTFDTVKNLIEENKLPIELRLGMEIYYTKDSLRALMQKEALTLNDSKYALLELSMMNAPEDLTEIVYEFNMEGFEIILAHPERYTYYQQLDDLIKLKKKGVLVQLNTASILGLYGRKIKKNCLKLIKGGYVDFIASDSHNMRSRIPNLGEAYAYLSKKVKRDILDKIFVENPRLLEKSE